jgi:hypothetical protein
MARRAFARTKSGSGDCTVNFTPEMILTSGAHSKSEVQWRCDSILLRRRKVLPAILRPRSVSGRPQAGLHTTPN